jgi:hypothetical protein
VFLKCNRLLEDAPTGDKRRPMATSPAQSPDIIRLSETCAQVYDFEHGEPWYDDGNIIIQAESTLFKVYRGILAQNSTVFEDMLVLPQPIVGDDVIEGCPVVRLMDTAENWSHVLKAICDRRSVTLYLLQFSPVNPTIIFI